MTSRYEDLLAAVEQADAAVVAAEDLLFDAVQAARDNGATWQMIGDRLTVSKQAAQQRFGHGRL